MFILCLHLLRGIPGANIEIQLEVVALILGDFVCPFLACVTAFTLLVDDNIIGGPVLSTAIYIEPLTRWMISQLCWSLIRAFIERDLMYRALKVGFGRHPWAHFL
jgi:hypothetical protein